MSLFTGKLLSWGTALVTSMIALCCLVVSDVGKLMGSSTAVSVTASDSWTGAVYQAGLETPDVIKRDADGAVLWRTRVTRDQGAQVLAISHSRGNGRLYVAGRRNGGGFLAQIATTGEKISYRRLTNAALALTTDLDGNVLVGGEGFLQKLDADLSPEFDLAVMGRVNGLAFDARGSAYATIEGAKARVAKLDPDGEGWKWSADLVLAPASLMVDCTGTIYVQTANAATIGFDSDGDVISMIAPHGRGAVPPPVLLSAAVTSLRRLL